MIRQHSKSAVPYVLAAWLIFAPGELVFLGFGGIYLALGMTAAGVTAFLVKKNL